MSIDNQIYITIVDDLISFAKWKLPRNEYYKKCTRNDLMSRWHCKDSDGKDGEGHTAYDLELSSDKTPTTAMCEYSDGWTCTDSIPTPNPNPNPMYPYMNEIREIAKLKEECGFLVATIKNLKQRNCI